MKYVPHTERYGAAAPVLWLIDELWDDFNEHRPRALRQPTLASGCEAQPPEGTSDGGTTGFHYSLRMVGNGETDLPSNVTPIGKARKGGVL